MKNAMDLAFHEIIILDSIPEGDLNTADLLFEHLDNSAHELKNYMEVQYKEVKSSSEFIEVVNSIRERVLDCGKTPLLHIECHGSEDGLQFADGSCLSWLEMQGPLALLNASTGFNLIVVVAACEGFQILNTIDPKCAAPAWGFIGPTQPVSPTQILDAYKPFYREIIGYEDPVAALEALRASTSEKIFSTTTTIGLFKKSWKRLEENYIAGDKLFKWAEDLSKKTNDLPVGKEISPEEMDIIILQKLRTYHEEAWETFFMHKLVPSNTTRFPLEPLVEI